MSMTENEKRISFVDHHINQIIRDGFAAEVFLGDTDGETVRGDCSHLTAPMQYLLGLKTTSGYKAFLYFDAMSKFFDYYLQLAGSNRLSNPEKYLKIPLYIPKTVMPLISESITSGYLQYAQREGQSILSKEEYEEIIAIWDFYNQEVVPKYIAYVQAQGVLHIKPSKAMFSKIEENKRTFQDHFETFRNKMGKHEELLKRFVEVSGMDLFYQYYNKKRIRNIVFQANSEEMETIKSFLSYEDHTSAHKIVFTGRSNEMFFASPLAPERPLCVKRGGVRVENLYTVADMLIYADAAFADSSLEEVYKVFHLAANLFGNRDFETKIDDMLQVGKKYNDAYAKVSPQGSSSIVVMSYLKELQDASMDRFEAVVNKKAERIFSIFLEDEFKKHAKVSVFTAAEESFAFSAALFFIKNTIRQNIELLFTIKNEPTLEKDQREQIKGVVKRLVEKLVALYLEKREAYISSWQESVSSQEKTITEEGGSKKNEAYATENSTDAEEPQNTEEDEATGSEEEQVSKPVTMAQENNTASATDNDQTADEKNGDDDESNDEEQYTSLDDISNQLADFE